LGFRPHRNQGLPSRWRSSDEICRFELKKEVGEMNYLVTGGRGMLGREFARELAGMHNARHFAPDKHQLDVRNESAMNAAAEHAKGGWVIHCAAIVSVEDCARDPDTAREIIVDGTRHAITTAKSAGARLF
jgi:dTDP-4-dehydrorhamnose reductase